MDVITWALSAWLQGVRSPWTTQQQARAELPQPHQCSRHWGAWPRAGGTAVWLFPKGPWRYLQPHLQGKVWSSGRRAGSVVGERSGLIPPPGELVFSLPGLEGPCLEGDSKPGTILMPPPPLASGGPVAASVPAWALLLILLDYRRLEQALPSPLVLSGSSLMCLCVGRLWERASALGPRLSHD